MEFFNAEDAEITQRAQRFILYFLCVLCVESASLAEYSPLQER